MSSSKVPRLPWWKNTRGEWYVIVQMVLFALVALGPTGNILTLSLPAPWNTTTRIVGFLLGAAGLVLAFAGLFALGPNLSALPHPKAGAQMVESGVYRVVRHPIYSGLIVGAVGWALLTLSGPTLIYAAVLFVFFDLKSRREERWLLRTFPGYAAYRARVHKLIPFVY